MREGICYVFGAGDYYGPPPCPGEGDFVIAADGGCLHLQGLGLSANLIVGDFDSMPRPAEAEAGGVPLVVLPREKDETDMLAALRAGLARGYRRFHLYGGTGGRLDHTLANIQCLAWLRRRNAQGFLFDRETVLTVLSAGALSFPAGTEGLLSVFALDEKVCGVFERGFRYPLTNATLHNHDPLGVSNVFTGEAASVSVARGMLLVVYPRGAEAEVTGGVDLP